MSNWRYNLFPAPSEVGTDSTAPFRADCVTSTTTAKIMFEGREIGELQDFSFDENFSLIPIDELGTCHPVGFLPGFYKGSITATCAFINPDLFFTALNAGTELPWRIKQQFVGTTDIDITDFATYLNSVGLDYFNNTFTRMTDVISFDINVYDKDDVLLFGFQDCTLGARRVSISVGNVLIMQNLTMMYRRRI